MLNRINTFALSTTLALAACVEAVRNREEGQTMAEYAVVLAVITAAIIATLGVLSGKIDGVLVRVSGAIN